MRVCPCRSDAQVVTCDRLKSLEFVHSPVTNKCLAPRACKLAFTSRARWPHLQLLIDVKLVGSLLGHRCPLVHPLPLCILHAGGGWARRRNGLKGCHTGAVFWPTVSTASTGLPAHCGALLEATVQQAAHNYAAPRAKPSTWTSNRPWRKNISPPKPPSMSPRKGSPDLKKGFLRADMPLLHLLFYAFSSLVKVAAQSCGCVLAAQQNRGVGGVASA